jgi:hypothetical protein
MLTLALSLPLYLEGGADRQLWVALARLRRAKNHQDMPTERAFDLSADLDRRILYQAEQAICQGSLLLGAELAPSRERPSHLRLEDRHQALCFVYGGQSRRRGRWWLPLKAGQRFGLKWDLCSDPLPWMPRVPLSRPRWHAASGDGPV